MKTTPHIPKRPAVPASVVATVLPGTFCRSLLLFTLVGSLLTSAHATIPAAAIANPLYAKGYLVVSHYPGVFTNGTNAGTTTTGLNQALRDAYDNRLIAYFPEGTYLINDRLKAHTATGTQDYPAGPLKQTFATPRDHLAIVGSTKGRRPLIQLASSALGFDDQANPKPMLEFKNYARKFLIGSQWAYAQFYNDPNDVPDVGETLFVEEADSGYHQMVRGIDLDCGGKPGAIGLYFNEAQNCSIENVKIFADGAFAGIRGIPGAASIVVNIEVEGGQYGIYTNTDKAGGCVIAGAKLSNQTVSAVRYDGFVPLVLVGFEIVTPANSTQAAVTIVPNPGDPKANTSGVHLIDGIIRLGGNPAVAAINNAIGKNFYARNVYVGGGNPNYELATTLVKSGAAAATAGTGFWKRIDEYSYCDQASADPSSEGGKESFSLIGAMADKTPAPLNNGVIATVTNSVGSAPGDLLSRHTWAALPSVDDLDAVDAYAEGIEPALDESDPAVVSSSALQALINNHRKIFLRKGIYRLTGPINLKADTILFGADRNLTRIEVAQGWSDNIAATPSLQIETSMITTDNSSTATTYLGDLSIGVHCGKPPSITNPDSEPDPDPSDWFTALDWRAGKDSMVHIGQIYREPFDVMPRWKTNKHNLIRIRQSGGGRWYHVGSVKYHTSEHLDYRIVKVEGTTAPLWFYGLDPEHPKGCDAFVEFNNAQNVRIYSVKSEFNSDTGAGSNSPAAKSVALKFINSQNIALFGYGAIRNGVNNRGIIEFRNSDRVLATLIAPEKDRFSTASDDTLRELDSAGNRTKGVAYPHVVAIYKRGTITSADEAVMVHGDSFYGPELTFASIPGEDGWVLEGATAGQGGSLLKNGTGTQALSIGDNASMKQYRSILSFDTSPSYVPANAIIVGASLSLRRGYGSVAGSFGRLVADIKTGTFGIADLESTDFQASASAVDVIPVFPIPTNNGELIEGELSSSSLNYISRTGQTQFRIRFQSVTDNDNNADILGFYSGENTSANVPLLSVRYGQPPN